MRSQKPRKLRTRRPRHTPRPRRTPRLSARPLTANQFFALTDGDQVRWESATRAVSHMRDKRLSLQQAADDAQLTPALLKRLAGSAIKKRANGRYIATSYDRLLRVLVTPAADGMREVETRDSREASKLSRHSHALDLLLHGKDSNAITAFENVRVRLADGSTISLLTNIEDIRRLANAGVLSFESIYAKR